MAQSRRNDDVSRWRQGAARLGITYQTYRKHALDGERWCSRHRKWLPATAFRPNQGYDRNTYCVACRREINHEYYISRGRGIGRAS